MSFSRRIKNWDILCAGELLAALQGDKESEKAGFHQKYELLPSGDLSKLAMNMARLGNRTRLVASVGLDEMGTLLYRKIESLGIDLGSIRMVESPTTLSLQSPGNSPSNTQVYRNADFQFTEDQMSNNVLADVTLFHSTCFALSKEPARSIILNAAGMAYDLGSQLTLDLNYSSRIWPATREAQRIVAEYCQLRPLVMVNEKNWEDYSNQAFKSPRQVAQHFLALGASWVTVLLDSGAALVANQEEEFHLPTKEPLDALNGEAAFWAGFLSTWLDGGDLKKCGLAGQSLAEVIQNHAGPLPDRFKREELIAG